MPESGPLLSRTHTPIDYEKIGQLISDVVDDSKIAASEDTETKNKWYRYILPVSALFLRACSVSFRGRTINDLGDNMLRIPFLHQLDSSSAQIGVVYIPTGLFATTDGIMTLISSKRSVFQLCLHPNYRKGIQTQWHRFKSGEYPRPLLFLAPFGMAATGLRGYAGVTWALKLCDPQSSSVYLNVFFNTFAVITGVFSAFCFLAFQINQQAFRNIQIKNKFNLEENKEMVCLFENEHKWRFRQIGFSSLLLTIAASMISGLAVFYSKGDFEVTWKSGLFASLLVVSNALLNIFYITNPTYQYWATKDICEKAVKKDRSRPLSLNINADDQEVGLAQKESGSVQALKLLLKVVGGVSAIGTGLALGPGIIHALLLASSTKKIEEASLPVCIAGLVLTFLFSILSASRDFVVWTLSSLPNLFQQNKTALSLEQHTNKYESTTSIGVA